MFYSNGLGRVLYRLGRVCVPRMTFLYQIISHLYKYFEGEHYVLLQWARSGFVSARSGLCATHDFSVSNHFTFIQIF
jgi:hypothetical protein